MSTACVQPLVVYTVSSLDDYIAEHSMKQTINFMDGTITTALQSLQYIYCILTVNHTVWVWVYFPICAVVRVLDKEKLIFLLHWSHTCHLPSIIRCHRSLLQQSSLHDRLCPTYSTVVGVNVLLWQDSILKRQLSVIDASLCHTV